MASEKKFNYVSPGVVVNEIDNTGRPDIAQDIGPVIIGRTERGPHTPTLVRSMSEFIKIFGNPVGGGASSDIWREGNKISPTYGAYAAQAWLANNSPITFIRLLGHEHENATTAGKAGWKVQGLGTDATSGGAYGLFLVDSGSSTDNLTGTLAAVFYIQSGSIQLSGTVANTSELTASVGTLIESSGADQEFNIVIKDGSLNTVKKTACNFNETSRNFVRKVFNTNPTLINSTITPSDSVTNYWLGETFEKSVNTLLTGSGVGATYGIIVGLKDAVSTNEKASYRMGTQSGRSGWIIGQDLDVVSGETNTFDPQTMTKLFRFHGLHNGEWIQNNVKISISEIRSSRNENNPYGSFTVTLRRVSDSDNAVDLIERYKNCNLNPNSPDYIAKKIGDHYLAWDDTERKYIVHGDYENNSKFVRVEMNPIVSNGGIPSEMLPFGFFGPVRHKGFKIAEGDIKQLHDADTTYTSAFVVGDGEIYDVHESASAEGHDFYFGGEALTCSFLFPSLSLRNNSFSGTLSDPRESYFGIEVGKSTSTTIFQHGYGDYLRALSDGFDSFSEETDTEYAFIFTLDDVSGSSTNNAYYVSGSRAAGTSLTANGNYKSVLDAGYDKFTMCLNGAFDGLDITEQEPFRNSNLTDGSETTNYAFNSIKRSIDAIQDPEEFDLNILSMPGLTNQALNQHMILTSENRRDCVAIIDTNGNYTPPSENNSTETERLGTPAEVVQEIEDSAYNSTYAAAYSDWVRIKDIISGKDLWVPPSVAAIGTVSYTQKTKDLWYAPAGVQSGGLSKNKSAGIPVVGIRQRLRTKDRDLLYENRVNPITSFKGSGIVIWGQKTLGVTNSATSRLDVRLLVNHIKKNIARISRNFIFEKNVFETWLKWRGRINPFLADIKSKFGLEDYKIKLDRSTTTPELVDRNVMYAKIFIVPARSIEHIEVDLQLDPSGVSYND